MGFRLTEGLRAPVRQINPIAALSQCKPLAVTLRHRHPGDPTIVPIPIILLQRKNRFVDIEVKLATVRFGRTGTSNRVVEASD